MFVLSDFCFSDTDNIKAGEVAELINGEISFAVSDIDISDEVISGATYNNLHLQRSVYFTFPINGNPNPCWNNIDLLKENALIVVTNRKIDGVNCIIVKNVEEAYRRLAACYRSSFAAKVVGVTGSVGKTTTSAMIAAVLGTVRKTQCSNSRNVPTVIAENMLKLQKDTDFFVLEMASSQPGQIRRSAAVAQVDAAVITNIGTAHIDLMGTQQNILDTKLQILDNSHEGAPFFANIDDEYIGKINHLDGHPIVSFGINCVDADYRADNIRVENDIIIFDIVYGSQRKEAVLHIHGRHNIYNALAAFAIGKWAGLEDDDILRGLSEFRTVDGVRQSVYNSNGVTVIADYFSIDTLSMISAFKALNERQCAGKKIAVLGHIMRMGEHSREMHRMVGDEVVNNNIDLCLCYDDDSKWIAERVNELGGNAVYFGNNKWKLIEYLRKNTLAGDAVLFKGAQKYSHFEDVVETVFGIYPDKNSQPEIHAYSAAAYDLSAGKIIYCKNQKKRLAPISLTMIMTAIVAIENCHLGDMVYAVPQALRFSGSGYSNIKLKEGELLSVEDLLHAVMIGSAFDAASVLADYAAGTESAFVELMNRKAAQLKMDNTHFTNVCGINETEHYSCAEDLVRLCEYALKNTDFKRIAACKKYVCTDGRVITNKNRLLNEGSVYYYPRARGLKTTNSPFGKYCAAVYAENNGKEALTIVMQSPDEPRQKDHDQNTPDLMYSLTDSMKLCEYVLGGKL